MRLPRSASEACPCAQRNGPQPGRDRAHWQVPSHTEERVDHLWYVVGFAFAGVTFVFLTIAASWLLTHRTKGDGHKGLPYESGIDTYGDTHARFGISFYIYALLFVAFDIEVVFIYLWARVFQDRSLDAGPLFLSMLVFVGILLLGLAYAWRKKVLTWR